MENIFKMLSESTKEVFHTMMSLEINVHNEQLAELSEKIHLSSIITLDGTVKGAIVFHCTNKLALQITSSLLDEEKPESLNEMDIRDAIAEVTNIIAGNLKTKVSDLGHSFSISLPKTMNWQEYLDETKYISKERIIKFKSKEEYFFLELLSENKEKMKKAS